MSWLIILAVILSIGFVLYGRYHGFEFSESDSDNDDFPDLLNFINFFD
ncbi:hypothetical protein N9B73_01950 [Verrucomicrobiales bacterium]|nr:hypothetical protein [Verrucomicrobiales bacterium]